MLIDRFVWTEFKQIKQKKALRADEGCPGRGGGGGLEPCSYFMV
jgi:hypothetical protein